MADPLAPTVPFRPRAEPAEGDREAEGAGAAEIVRVIVAAAGDVDPIARGIARARAEAGLFGEATAHTIGRYRMIERAGAGGMGVVWSAWDPELGRGVALKLASSGDARTRAQVLDEGRALARLSHPNVVPIFDVLDAPEGVFLVMELVKGRTLREFAATASVTELLRAYRQAGEGLAAAHQAGLIHRDFKADNAILGADDRVRVLDFGLAHGIEDTGVPTIAGTPRYMAPEQRDGLALTPAVDQYGLCVALEEALRSRGPVPKWLVPILARGSARDTGDRYAGMAELVRALALTPAAKWRQRALIAGSSTAVVAIVAAFAIGRARRAAPPCENGAALIAPSWGPAVRGRALAHLATLASGYAPEARVRIVEGLDRYATQWIDVQRDACLAHQAGTISEAMLDRRDVCLARRNGALAAIGELATSADAAAISGIVIAVGSLPALAACGDDDSLLSPVAPPPTAIAARVALVADRIGRVDVERDAGRTEEASRDAQAAMVEARGLGYPPVLARALVARGRIALSLSDRDRGAGDFTEATRLALAVGDDALAIEAYARAAYAIATTSAESATEGLALIEAITTRAGSRAAFARALLHHNIGAVALAAGDRVAARRWFERARGEASGLTGGAAIELTSILLGLMIVVDDPVVRDQIGASLVASRIAVLGPNHPSTLEAEIMRASLASDPRRVRDALAPPCTAMATLHPEQRASIRECAYEVTWRALVAGDDAVAATMAARVIAAADPDASNSDSRVVRAHAFLRLARGDAAGAASELAAIEPNGDGAQWWKRLTTIDVALGLALAHQAANDPASSYDLEHVEFLCHHLAAAPPLDIAARLDAVATLRARR